MAQSEKPLQTLVQPVLSGRYTDADLRALLAAQKAGDIKIDVRGNQNLVVGGSIVNSIIIMDRENQVLAELKGAEAKRLQDDLERLEQAVDRLELLVDRLERLLDLPPRRKAIIGLSIVAIIGLVILLATSQTGPPQLPSLTPFNRFDNLHVNQINDVAAASGIVWFATDIGLFEYHASDGSLNPVQGVNYPLTSVATTADGLTVWFGIADTNDIGGTNSLAQTVSERVGRYISGGQPERFMPATPDGQQIQIKEVLTILIASDNTVWFGDKFNEVFRYTSDGQWQSLPLTPFSMIRADKLALAPAQTLWAANGSSLFRFPSGGQKPDDWKRYTSESAPDMLPSDIYINDLLTDADQHLWIASNHGLTVLTGDLTGDVNDFGSLTCKSPPLQNEAVGALAGGNQGRAVWLVTSVGVARLEVEQTPAPDCKNWNWITTPEQTGIKDFLSASGIRMAVDDAADHDTVWLVNGNSNRVYTLTYPPNTP